MKIKVGVLFGGKTVEHEISIISAIQAIGHLDKNYDESKIYVASDINEALTHVYALNSQGKKKIVLLENDLPDNY